MVSTLRQRRIIKSVETIISCKPLQQWYQNVEFGVDLCHKTVGKAVKQAKKKHVDACTNLIATKLEIITIAARQSARKSPKFILTKSKKTLAIYL